MSSASRSLLALLAVLIHLHVSLKISFYAAVSFRLMVSTRITRNYVAVGYKLENQSCRPRRDAHARGPGTRRVKRLSVACACPPARVTATLARSLQRSVGCFAAGPVTPNLWTSFPAEIQCKICRRRGNREFARAAEIAAMLL